MSRTTHDGFADAPVAASSDADVSPAVKRREIGLFLVLAFLIWPILSVAVVGGYGFLVWMLRILTGPPGV